MSDLYKIVIVGGGVAGLMLATKLGNRFRNSVKTDILLVDSNLSYVWKPLWHEIAAGRIDINKEKTEYLAHGEKHGFKFWLGSLVNIDRQRKVVQLEQDMLNLNLVSMPTTITYDLLVLALGSVHNGFNTPGVAEYCFTFDSLHECELFHATLMMHILKIIQEGSKKEFHLVIIGGGATGIELALEVKDYIAKLLKYQSLSTNDLHINLSIIETSQTLLRETSAGVRSACICELGAKDIKIYLNEKAIKIDEDFIFTESGKRIPADIKLWTAGIKAPDLFKSLNLLINSNCQVLIRDSLQTLDDGAIFAIGDCANFEAVDKSLPASAQLAYQQVIFLFHSISNCIQNGWLFSKFEYQKQGSIISAGGKKAIGEIENSLLGKLKFNQSLAYFSYRYLYRRYQAGLHGWLKVIFLILLDFFSRKIRPKIKLH